ncbi:hypothetical protein JAAARDRAFT_530504 [Jaapia argillacea MUCL 33604]|uniref:PNPLA domain-containing protein n=1 Tax=Jaapia argillacea MUCL 33604 TaxID=933084 RepID=A0A067P984_9AGAM|nr:hypothetical protein JAAARDRAFT_530504 [Jaapia argillacea MUCL 33604]
MASIPHHHERVLSIDGGGFQGLKSLLIMESIMQNVEQISQRPFVPAQVFDLICGTSTGGFLALLLGRFGLDCRTAIEVYKTTMQSLLGTTESEFWLRLLSGVDFEIQAYEDALRGLILTYGGDPDLVMMGVESGTSHVSHGGTKTFVTVGADTPHYDNMVYHVRSYPPPPHSTQSSPPGHEWSVREAARTTLANPIYLPRFKIRKDDVEFSFQDAGLCGFTNPTRLACREAQKLWPLKDIGVVVSLGTGFSELYPPPKPTQAWFATEAYLKPFVDDILEKVPSEIAEREISRRRAMTVVKNLVSGAVDSELVHLDVSSRILNTRYYRFNPSSALPTMEIADIFHFELVEQTIRDWLASPKQKENIRNVATKLVDLNREFPVRKLAKRPVNPTPRQPIPTPLPPPPRVPIPPPRVLTPPPRVPTPPPRVLTPPPRVPTPPPRVPTPPPRVPTPPPRVPTPAPRVPTPPPRVPTPAPRVPTPPPRVLTPPPREPTPPPREPTPPPRQPTPPPRQPTPPPRQPTPPPRQPTPPPRQPTPPPPPPPLAAPAHPADVQPPPIERDGTPQPPSPPSQVELLTPEPTRTSEPRPAVKAPSDIAAARTMEPPPPPPDTNIGYNPQLDKKRPQTMQDYLSTYRVVFVIDDSRSMLGEKWRETSRALSGIAGHAVKTGTKTVEIRFLNSTVVCEDVTNASTIEKAFKQVSPRGSTPTGRVLGNILNTQIARLDAAISTEEYRDIEPLDIIVITDGAPSQSSENMFRYI